MAKNIESGGRISEITNRIKLPPDKIDYMGRALLPDPTHPTIIQEENSFGFTSMYRTFDRIGISFVAQVPSERKGRLMEERVTMAMPDFIAMVLDEAGRDSKNLTNDEKKTLARLGFRDEELQEAEETAIRFNQLRRNTE